MFFYASIQAAFGKQLKMNGHDDGLAIAMLLPKKKNILEYVSDITLDGSYYTRY